MNKSRKPVLIFVGFALLACFGFLYFEIAVNPHIIFLTGDNPAQWIRYPAPPQTVATDRSFHCVFETNFQVDEIPPHVILHLKALRRFRLWINDREVSNLPDQTDWKKGIRLDIKGWVHRGKNTIRIRVTNNHGPALLCLKSDNPGIPLYSDTSWRVSLSGSPFVPAIQARDTTPAPISYKGPRPFSSLHQTWPWLVLAFLLSVSFFTYLQTAGPKKPPEAGPSASQPLLTPKSVLLFTLIMWMILFVRHLKINPIIYGFDVDGHLAYIVYLLARHSLPLATSGWEMYQPPLFYLLSAVVLKIYGFALPFIKNRYALEIIPFLSGAGQIYLGYLTAKLVFRDQPCRQMIAVALVGFIPMNIYCSFYISNQPLSAFLISLSLYFALKILVEEGRRKSSFMFLGLSIGLGLLTKITILLVIPVILLILIYSLPLYHRLPARRVCSRVGATAVIAILISSWYYVRNWIELGAPVVGNWNAITRMSWWEGPGFHTASYFMQFGRVFHLPYFAGFYSFFDGLYATFWGDSLYGGTAKYIFRPPWNYNFMSSGYLLAFPVTLAMIIGIVCMLWKWLKTMDMKWFMLLGYIFVFLFGITYMCLRLPYYGQTKAFYGLGMIIPLALAAGWTIDTIDAFLKKRSRHIIRAMMWGWLGTFLTCVFMSYWTV